MNSLAFRISYGFLLFLPLILGCASAQQTVYNPTPVRGIQSWDLRFAYEVGSVSEKQISGGDKEVTVTSAGRSARDLQLRDDIYFLLRDNYGLKVSKGVDRTEGTIQLNPVHFYNGGFKSLDVLFEDSQGSVLARLRVKNSDWACCIKDDDKFAEYAASRITELMQSLPAK